MFFVPMGAFKNREWFRTHRLREEHIDVLIQCLRHSVRWAEDIMNKFYIREPLLLPVRLVLKLFLSSIRKNMARVKPALEAIIANGERR